MRNLWTVFKFTFLERFKTKSFVISTLSFAALIAVLCHLPAILSAFNADKPKTIGVLHDATGVAEDLAAYFGRSESSGIRIETFQDRGSKEANEQYARQQVDKKAWTGYLILEPGRGDFPKAVYASTGTFGLALSEDLAAALQAIRNERILQEASVPQELRQRLNENIALEVRTIATATEDGGTKSDRQYLVHYFLVYALLILLFMVNSMYGQMIAVGITTEKNSRVMELIVSSISSVQHLFGKVLAFFAIAILQTAIFLAVAAFNLMTPDNRDFFKRWGVDPSAVPASLYVYFVLFFVLGFFLYAVLYAMIGSLTSRMEEAGQAAMPVVLLLLIAFYIAIFGINAPHSAVVTAASFIPFFTPMVMFLRIGMANPAGWEIALSLVLLIATSLGVGWLAARVYRVGVLMYGKRPSVREIRQAMKSLGGTK